MEQLTFTTSEPQFMGMQGEPLINIKDKGDLITDEIKGRTAYIHGDAEELAGYDIPIFISGNTGQLDLDPEDQDILMILPSGEYPCKAQLRDDPSQEQGQYLLTLK